MITSDLNIVKQLTENSYLLHDEMLSTAFMNSCLGFYSENSLYNLHSMAGVLHNEDGKK